MTESEKLRALAYGLRNRAAAPDIGEQRKDVLAMAARFEAFARETERREAAGTKRLSETAGS